MNEIFNLKTEIKRQKIYETFFIILPYLPSLLKGLQSHLYLPYQRSRRRYTIYNSIASKTFFQRALNFFFFCRRPLATPDTRSSNHQTT